MFRKLTVTETPLTLQPGAVLKLTKDQARRRHPFITAGEERKGTIVATAHTAVQFKVGETIEFDPKTVELPPRYTRTDDAPEHTPAEFTTRQAAIAAETEAKRAAEDAAKKQAEEDAAEAKRLADEEAQRLADEEAAKNRDLENA